MKFKYDKEKNAVVEIIEVENVEMFEDIEALFMARNQAKADSRTFPLSQPVDWEDGREVEEGRDFEIRNDKPDVEGSFKYDLEAQTETYTPNVGVATPLPSEAKESEEELCCPFCNDNGLTGFDKMGLKHHLINHCEAYNKVPNL